jgi:hypothetical protein
MNNWQEPQRTQRARRKNLKTTQLRLALLIEFRVLVLKDGIERVARQFFMPFVFFVVQF